MLLRSVLRVPCRSLALRRAYSDAAKGAGSESPAEPKPKANRFAQQYSKPAARPRQNNRQNNTQRQQNQSPRVNNQQSQPRQQQSQQQQGQRQQSQRQQGQQQRGQLQQSQQQQGQQQPRGRNSEKPNSGQNQGPQSRNTRQNAAPAQRKPAPGKKPKKRRVQRQLVKIQVPPFVTVANLAAIMKVTMKSMLRKLEDLGFEDMRHNYILDRENAAMIADEYGFQIEDSSEESADVFAAPEKPELLQERPPVVTIMGHVDHGKTTILDYLRKSSIVSQEFGGITQHIGAFSVTTPQSKKKITFLDTPGHAAFLKMRERGAIITDIVILVVAAEDSVMPQTIEAIKHAKKSGVPMIVAINKCDKPGVDIDKVLSDLSANGVDIEDYGGDTQTVRVSGKTGMNMDKLEEAVITLSEMSEFKAEPKGVPAEGWIIESQVEKGMGHVATVLVRRGTLKPGDVVVAGQTYCRIKGMRDEHGKAVKAAGPSTPVRVWSWKDLPDSGDQLLQAKTEQIAKKAIDYRTAKLQEIQATRDMEIINEQRAEQLKEAERKEKIAEMKKEGLDTSALEEAEQESKSITCNYIVKSDVFGSAEAIKESIDGMGNDEVKAVVISTEAGAPTDSDLDMAKTFDATIFCFNLKVPKPIAARADREKIKIVEHNVIYRLIEEVTEELSSKLTPIVEHKTVGEVEIRNLFNVTINKQKVKVAGCKVSSGAIKMSSSIKVMRGDEEIFRGKLSSLKDVKENITEATKGKECGISFDKWTDFEIGDKIVAYEEILHKRYL